MPDAGAYDAVVVGAGPNGLACGIELARNGWSVLLLEAADTVGGGCRTAELTLPGYLHDVCSAIHPMALASPFLRSLPLRDFGVSWVHPQAPLAHPLDDGSAAVLERSLEGTAASLGPDGDAYRKLLQPTVEAAAHITEQVLGPLRPPRHPVELARYGLRAIRSVEALSRSRFAGPRAPALLAGIGAHAMVRLDRIPTGAIALLFAAIGHRLGWPMVQGGSQRLVDALAAHLRGLGGEIECGRRITSLRELPASRVVVLDVTPRQLLTMAGDRLSPSYRRRLRRFRYGPGVFKVDWALDAPIPWKSEACARAATVHLGGTMDEIARAEAETIRGDHPAAPFVILAQQSLFDATRAPAGKHTAWAYCHVPHGSAMDMTGRIEDQVERFAPGFRDLILARATHGPAAMEAYNPNYVGGDINGGSQDLRQLFTRPLASIDPYRTADERTFLCSSSTPPGGGVHGMCGYFAARSVLSRWG